MIKYTIEKHHGLWTVWKNSLEHGIGFMGVYTPLEKNTKKACEEWCKLRGLKVETKHKKSNSKKTKRTEEKV